MIHKKSFTRSYFVTCDTHSSVLWRSWFLNMVLHLTGEFLTPLWNLLKHCRENEKKSSIGIESTSFRCCCWVHKLQTERIFWEYKVFRRKILLCLKKSFWRSMEFFIWEVNMWARFPYVNFLIVECLSLSWEDWCLWNEKLGYLF